MDKIWIHTFYLSCMNCLCWPSATLWISPLHAPLSHSPSFRSTMVIPVSSFIVSSQWVLRHKWYIRNYSWYGKKMFWSSHRGVWKPRKCPGKGGNLKDRKPNIRTMRQAWSCSMLRQSKIITSDNQFQHCGGGYSCKSCGFAIKLCKWKSEEITPFSSHWYAQLLLQPKNNANGSSSK